jgi:ferredoxin
LASALDVRQANSALGVLTICARFGSTVLIVKPSIKKCFKVGVVAFTHRAIERSVVDAAHENGIEVPYSCKGGMCCTCRAKLIEGEVSMDANYSLEPWELEAGYILTCQARPTCSKVVIDYDHL